jgi:hypothetical protein
MSARLTPRSHHSDESIVSTENGKGNFGRSENLRLAEVVENDRLHLIASLRQCVAGNARSK